MIKPIKILLTTAGASTDTFSLFSDADGFVTPFATGITKAQLLAGYISSVAPNLTNVVRVKSNTACMNSIDVFLPVITLSTTSTLVIWSVDVVNNGSVLTWDVMGDITPTSQNIDIPTFDLSANIGTVDMNIYDISGLDGFYPYGLQLVLLDVSKALSLTELNCKNNSLTSLNISQNTLLIQLDCSGNQIELLDISQNTLLRILFCYNNLLPPSEIDQIYIDLDTNGQSMGLLHIKNNRTTASDTARANLISKGWNINDTYTT